MILKNRKIYGITSTNTGTQFYVNFGESRYAYVDIHDIVINIETWKFYFEENNKEQFVDFFNLKINLLPRAFYYDNDSIELLKSLSVRDNLRVQKIIANKYAPVSLAIDKYMNNNGRFWKSKLRNEFEHGLNREPLLQQFRNKYLNQLNKMKQNYWQNARILAKADI